MLQTAFEPISNQALATLHAGGTPVAPGGRGVRSPRGGLSRNKGAQSKQATATIGFATNHCLRFRPQMCGLQVIGRNFL